MIEQTLTQEAELIVASQNGKDEAFQELMTRYMGPIFNFSRQYSKTDEDAEDITQDTFFKAWRHIKRFDASKAFKPWLYAIARNTALDHLKRKRASAFSELDGEETDIQFSESLEDTEPTPGEIFERQELAAEVAESMRELHPDHRAVLLMHYREELTFSEIADIMKKPMNTVKSWHRRALSKLKKTLSHRKIS
ncbi:MAG TPA: sigma-70 family RNA polymerase sigma factor [Candidatus Paceibacterota bacterium]